MGRDINTDIRTLLFIAAIFAGDARKYATQKVTAIACAVTRQEVSFQNHSNCHNDRVSFSFNCGRLLHRRSCDVPRKATAFRNGRIHANSDFHIRDVNDNCCARESPQLRTYYREFFETSRLMQPNIHISHSY